MEEGGLRSSLTMLLQYFLELSNEYVCLLGLVVLSCAAYQSNGLPW